MLKLVLFLFCTFCLTNSLAYGTENNKTIARWYKIYWHNSHVADLKAELSENSFTARIDTIGTLKKVSKYSNHAQTKFVKSGDNYKPLYFNIDLKQRHGNKDIKITYGKKSEVIYEKVTPPDNRAKRPAVSKEEKDNALNPLIASLVARDKIKQAIKDGNDSFNFNIYEGRRLSQLDFKIYGKESIKLNKKRFDVIKISFKRIPIEGYTNRELERIQGEEPDFMVYLEVTDLIPVKAEAFAQLGKALFLLEKECRIIEECV